MGCVIERVLGVKSIWTNALAGCSIGLAFGAKRGPAVQVCIDLLALVCLHELCWLRSVWYFDRYVYVLNCFFCVFFKKQEILREEEDQEAGEYG